MSEESANTLGSSDWEALSDVLTSMSMHPANAMSVRQKVFFEGLCSLLGADQAILIVALQEPSALVSKAQRENPVILGKWRPYKMIYHNVPKWREALGRLYAKSMKPALDDHMGNLFHPEGTHRVYLKSDASKEQQRYGMNNEMVRVHGLNDRMVGVHHLRKGVEVFVVCDRRAPRADFLERDRDLLLQVLRRMRPFFYHLCLSYGLLSDEGMEALTPRERETLLLLLGSKTEKEMASEMGLTPRSMHQYVIKVYRKLNVGSRAELMTLWLDVC